MLEHRQSTGQFYDAAFVRSLFDEMSRTYGVVNTLSSFGFAQRWRRQCVEGVQLAPGMTVVDLMGGCGECWPFILRAIGPSGSVISVDFSSEMSRRAREHAARRRGFAIEVCEQDALCASLGAESADAVVACFALKTLPPSDLARFGAQVARLLRPGGSYCAVEISAARRWWLGPLYRFYLTRIIPWIGWCLLGNPDNYRMLGVYTMLFEDCSCVTSAFRDAGLTAREFGLCYGCATGVSGTKPA